MSEFIKTMAEWDTPKARQEAKDHLSVATHSGFDELAILIIDRSGSMSLETQGIGSPRRYEDVINQLFMDHDSLIATMGKSKNVLSWHRACIGFGGSATTIFQPEPFMDQDGLVPLKKSLATDLQPLSTNTNLYDALVLAKQMADEWVAEMKGYGDSVPLVTFLVMTDGAHNDTQNPLDIAEQIKSSYDEDVVIGNTPLRRGHISCAVYGGETASNEKVSGGAREALADLGIHTSRDLMRAIASDPKHFNYREPKSGRELRDFFMASLSMAAADQTNARL